MGAIIGHSEICKNNGAVRSQKMYFRLSNNIPSCRGAKRLIELKISEKYVLML